MTNEKKAAISTGFTMFPTMILLVTTTVLAYIMQAYPTVAPSTVALLMTIPSLVSTAVSFLAGFIANKISHRLIVTFGMSCMFACGIIMYFGGGTAPFSLLILGVVLLGIGMGCNSVMTGTIVSLHMPREKIGSQMGMNNAVRNVGSMLLTAAAGVLAVSRWQNAYLVYLVFIPIIIVAAILTPEMPEEARQAAASQRGEQKEKARIPSIIWVISLLGSVFYLGQYVFSLNISNYIVNVYQLGTSAQAGLVTSVYTLGGVLGGLTFRWWSKAFKGMASAAVYLLAAAGLLITAFVTNSLAGAFAGAVLTGYGATFSSTFCMQQVALHLSPRQRSIGSSIYFGCTGVAAFLTTYIINGLASFIGGSMTANFIMGAVICGICALWAALMFSRKKEAQAE